MFAKRSSEEFFRYHDFTNWLDQTVNLTSGEVIVKSKNGEDFSTTMVSNVQVFENKKIIYKIKAGVGGHHYTVIIRAVDTNGQKWEDVIECEVL